MAEEVLPLEGTAIAFVDSREALAEAYRRGLPRSAEVRSVSPSLALERGLVATPAERRDAALHDILGEAIHQVTLDLFFACRGDAELAPLGIVLAQRALLLGGIALQAMTLKADDAGKRVALIYPTAANMPVAMAHRPPWERLLRNVVNFKTIEVPVSIAEDAGPQVETVGFWDRQKLGRSAKLAFQAASRVWRGRRLRSPRGTFLILRENALLREAAASLALRGYGLAWLESPSPRPKSFAGSDRLVQLAGAIIENHVRPLVAAFVWPALRTAMVEDLIVAAERYMGAVERWRTVFAELRRPVRGVLTNMLMIPEAPALSHVCREAAVPVFGFQHGTAREISLNNTRIEAYFEGNTTDYFYTYSPAAAEVSDRCALNSAKSIAVGLPAEYSRCATYRPRRTNSPTILFISSTLYAGHFSQMVGSRGLSDIEAAANDVGLVEEVLARVPYRVVFKPYPAARYPDPDPILVAAARAPNIEVFQGRDDVAFLIPDADIVISARATSSIAWGAVSGKPFVFLDHPTDLPLFADVRAAFDRAFFVFDRSMPDFPSSLRMFLSLPLAEIHRLWQAKAAARDVTLQRYFGENDGRAGRRAADSILAV